MDKRLIGIATSAFMLACATSASAQGTTTPQPSQAQPPTSQGGPGMMGPGMMGQRGMMGGGMMDMMRGRIGQRAMTGPVMRIIFALMDSNGDGTVSLQEFQAAHERIFKAMDANKDGVLTLEEIQSFMAGQPSEPISGQTRPAPQQ